MRARLPLALLLAVTGVAAVRIAHGQWKAVTSGVLARDLRLLSLPAEGQYARELDTLWPWVRIIRQRVPEDARVWIHAPVTRRNVRRILHELRFLGYPRVFEFMTPLWPGPDRDVGELGPMDFALDLTLEDDLPHAGSWKILAQKESWRLLQWNQRSGE